MQDKQSADDEKKGLILQQQHVQIREYSFHEEGSTESDSRYRSKFDLFLATQNEGRKI